MAKIDPKQRMNERKKEGWSEVPEEGGGSGPERVSTPVKAPATIVGFRRVKSAQKHTPGIEIRFILLEGAQAGKVVDRTFWDSSAFNDQIADFALALGYDEPFDADDDEDLAKVFSYKGGVIGVDVRAREAYTTEDGKTIQPYEARFFYRVPFESRPKKDNEADKPKLERWKETKKAGIQSWESYLDWRAKQAAKRAAEGGGRGGGRRKSDDDDDMPF